MTDKESTINDLKVKTSILAQYAKESGNSSTYQKVELFLEKLEKEEFTIAFSGHFSAGKSSMINRLIGENLLATSPIPTSANIVKIKRGEEHIAYIFRATKSPILLKGKADQHQLKELSKDGKNVARIEWEFPSTALPSGVTIMDTPGVDSTDDAHRISTESALHLADVVFYVMDYNHVQSSLNFQFTKDLLAHQENLYLIVNQVDKHQETELSLKDFRLQTWESFKRHGVEPKEIFFTSLKKSYEGENDLSRVEETIRFYMNTKESVFLSSNQQTYQQLLEEHRTYLQHEVETCKDNFSSILSDEEMEKISPTHQSTKKQEEQSLTSLEEWGDSFTQSRNKLLESGNVTPSEFRELLGSYMETLDPQFKMGILFSKKKTEEERRERKQRAFNKLEEIVENQFTLHVKRLMKQSLLDIHFLSDEKEQTIQALEIPLPADLLENMAPKGSIATGQALLNYSKNVADEVKRVVRDKTNDWQRSIENQLTEVSEEQKTAFVQHQQEESKKELAERSIQKVLLAQQQFEKEIAFPPLPVQDAAKKWFQNWKVAFEHLYESMEQWSGAVAASDSEMEPVQQDETSKTTDSHKFFDWETLKGSTNSVLDKLQAIPDYQESVEQVKKKIARFEQKTSTIALFGAFSAGKSSFANALLGEKVLPVSPNPMTAAITTIKPSTNEYAHATATIFFKTEKELFSDLKEAYAREKLEIVSLEEGTKRAKEVPQNAFIQAVAGGLQKENMKLGKSIQVNRATFEQYVADENKSSFVKKIDLFFDCELTKKGISLVDTPGADSIHARHTDVTFEYIRNADAILFVTYYNHAFARADREFLIQLGRVKDLFELDKMFFLVNAIDLADSMEEKEDVIDYVEQELQSFGIRFPKIFGVSSLETLNEKISGKPLNKDMKIFEEAFSHFIHQELTHLTMQRIQEDVVELKSRFQSLIEQTEANLQRKDERLKEIHLLEQKIRKRYATSFASTVLTEVKQEISELIYYVEQRVFFRFGDFFKESFHPSVFHDASTKVALRQALKETLAATKFDLEQELQVTNFRVDQWLIKKLKDRLQQEKIFWQQDFSFVPIQFEIENHDILTFDGPFESIEKYEHVFSYFKNTHSFFEKNEKEKMKQALLESSKEEAHQYLSQQKKELEQWVTPIIDQEMERLKQYVSSHLIRQLKNEEELLRKSEALAKWKEIQQSIQREEL
ncbi:dynamin family protein [Paenisporosarcina cavernae]|nr:dynamin family protein [Paenisporosarcina cavernae]